MSRLPEAVEALLEAALVAEFTVLDGRNRPVVHPMLPLYVGDGRIYLTSSVLFSRKLFHIRRNPRVALSITDPVAAPVARWGAVTIQGEATIDDADPHSGWLWLLPAWARKEPDIPRLVKNRWMLPLFWERAVIAITPRRIFHWPPGGAGEPVVYDLSEGG
ncbi:pyridoxamine 5'-phosphate oxidase family protein [Thermoflexus hugenholtzii]